MFAIFDSELRAQERNTLMPTTTEGKNISSKNALQHGLLSDFRVLPGLETEDRWQAHLEAFVADLHPEGPAEEGLAEKIAFLYWKETRLRRAEFHATVARW